MVRAVGLEPTLPKERHFECRASTNSTTPATAIPIAYIKRLDKYIFKKNLNCYAFPLFLLGLTLRTLIAAASKLFFI